MKPTKQKIEYEKVTTDDFVIGVIEDVIYEKGHKFRDKVKDPKKNTNGERISDAVRIKFIIDGCEYPKYSHWMSFIYSENSTLYKKYISSLVEGAYPDMDFDLDQIKGLKVKILWSNYGDKNQFQGVETIRPVGKKVVPLNQNPEKLEIAEVIEVSDANDAIEE